MVEIVVGTVSIPIIVLLVNGKFTRYIYYHDIANSKIISFSLDPNYTTTTTTTTTTQSSECAVPGWQGDSYCDDDNNNAGCNWDGGIFKYNFNTS